MLTEYLFRDSSPRSRCASYFSAQPTGTGFTWKIAGWKTADRIRRLRRGLGSISSRAIFHFSLFVEPITRGKYGTRDISTDVGCVHRGASGRVRRLFLERSSPAAAAVTRDRSSALCLLFSNPTLATRFHSPASFIPIKQINSRVSSALCKSSLDF